MSPREMSQDKEEAERVARVTRLIAKNWIRSEVSS
jgi:hypothetical protein